MKRILHISKYYYPFRGGTEQVARDCVNSLREYYEQKVICFSEGKNDSNDSVDGIDVIRAGCMFKLSSQSISLSYPRLLKEAIENYKPDIIIFHFPNPFVAHFLLKYIHDDCKLVVYWHLDIVKQRFLKLFFEGQTRTLLCRADKLIATSDAYVEGSAYLSSAKDKCVVIPNCIDTERLQMTARAEEIANEIRMNNEGKTICFAIGRHTKYKGFDYLIRSAHLLDDSFQFYIAGTGEETRRLIKEAGIDQKIHFLGIIDDDTLKAYYSAMDIFCFPSVTRNEAFGLTLAEAMYFGKPVVTFSIPGSGTNFVGLNRVTGIEVSNRDVEAYAAAIKELARNEHLRLLYGNAGKKRVEENFMNMQFTEKIVIMIRQLCDL